MAAIDISAQAEQFQRPRSVGPASPGAQSTWDHLARALQPLASLRLTVWLFVFAILLVFFGTLAQATKGDWLVVNEYFRSAVAWIEWTDVMIPAFFDGRPPERPLWFPATGIPFPGGWLIGGLMFINLLAAHLLRFKIVARGVRLVAGVAVAALGVLITYGVIISGSNKDGIVEFSGVTWQALWWGFEATMAVTFVAAVAGWWLIDRSRQVERACLLVTALLVGAALGHFLYHGEAARLSDSAMRILWQLMKGGIAGLVLLAGCWLLFKKRAGIVVLHGGIGLMMANEILVGTTHVESQMTIVEGQTVNWSQDIRHLELALVDSSSPTQDRVIAVPWSRLAEGKILRDSALPCDIELVKYYRNSVIREKKAGEQPVADQGLGVDTIVEESAPMSGAAGGKIDLASAVVKLYAKGATTPLGTYLLSQYFTLQDLTQRATISDRGYDIALRFQRLYKPYAVKLTDVRKSDYLGTATPRDYSSVVHLVDPTRHVDRDQVRIWMNNPLRFADETFYQSGYNRDPATRKESTTLQVVSNTGWMIPYVSCAIVGVGLLAQFLVTLTRFLGRQQTALPAELAKTKRAVAAQESSRGWLRPAVLVPAGMALLFGIYVIGQARTPEVAPGAMNLAEFGKLPLVYEGRVKPMDTLARTMLRAISGRETFVDEDGKTQPAIRWLLDVIARGDRAEKHRVFRQENLEALDLLGLERRKGFRYSISEFREHIGPFETEVRKAREVNPLDLSTSQRKMLALDKQLNLFLKLDASIHPRATPQLPSEEEIRHDPEGARERFRESLERSKQASAMLNRMEPPLIVPTSSEQTPWVPYANAVVEAYVENELRQPLTNPAVRLLARVFSEYANDNAAAFNVAVADYRAFLIKHPPQYSDVEPTGLEAATEATLTSALGFADSPFVKSDFEAWFNRFDLFNLLAYTGYFGAFVLTCLSWFGWSRTLTRSAFCLLLVTLVLHTAGLAARIYISGRPPVTNLYSAAVFIGWGTVVLGLVFELIYKLGIGNLVAAVAGFASLLVASALVETNPGDTFTVLQAVLDTQFWLATHVTCITLGYATTYVSGLLGIIYVLRGVLTRSLTAAVGKDLARMTYGTVCFALFFSFIGTVLGGLWADDSWGRFWGWDPKENGALIIVLWNAVILHARWGGLVRDQGLCVLAIVGNIVTSWSFFGVNELGFGLHSYGSTEGVLANLALFCASQMLIILVGCIPRDKWRSAAA